MSISTEKPMQGMTTAKKINALLNSSRTRSEGLELLKSYLSNCSDEDFLSCCVGWMQSCCKIDNLTNNEFAVNVLCDLFKISSKFQELKKPVSFFISARYFDYFFKHLLCSEPGWYCTETCLSLYRGSCGPFRENLEKHLKNLLAKNQVSSTVCRCYALVPCIGGGGVDGVNYKKNWKTQFSKFISVCHLILNDLFSDIEEYQDFKIPDNIYNENTINKSPEGLRIEFDNNINILCCMLLNSYPAPKSIPSDSVFELICRGLAVTPRTLAGRRTTSFMALVKILPHVHRCLFSLLKALVITAKQQLLPYSRLVAKLLKQSLEWTVELAEDSYSYLRVNSYETLCTWLTVAGHGSSVEAVATDVVSHAVLDVKPRKESICLKEAKAPSSLKPSLRVDSHARRTLCCAALKSLQFLLRSAGVALKPENHKVLQELAVELLIEIQKSAIDLVAPFGAFDCRKELYSLLLELVLHPCPEWPPPTNFALRLFGKGVNDPASEVSAFCFEALTSLTVIIHPQFDNGGFLRSETPEVVPREVISLKSDFVIEKGDDKAGESERILLESNENLEEEKRSNSNNEVELSIITTDLNKESDVSSDEDSRNTVTFSKDSWESYSKNVEVTKPIEERVSNENTETDDEPDTKKLRPSEPSEEKFENAEEAKRTPEPNKRENTEETKISTTPEPSKEEAQARARYYLRSKTKASSEEPDELSKNMERSKMTPSKTPCKTPVNVKRPRTRASSRAGTSSETESLTPEKTSQDEDKDEDIKAAFCDTFIN